MAGVLSRFYFATATTILIQQLKNSSNNRNTVKSTVLWLPVWKTEWCLNKGISKEIKITYLFIKKIIVKDKYNKATTKAV